MRPIPERQRLAEAIEKLAAADAYAAALAAKLVWSPAHRDELSAAEAALAGAKEQETANALARALGKPIAGPTVAEAQATVGAARAKYDADERDRELVRQERDRFVTWDLSTARDRRDEASAAIMAPTISELVAEFRRLDARMAAIYQAVNALPVECRPADGWSYRPMSFEAYERDATISWPLTAWREALLTDPTVPTPDLSPAAPLAEAAE